MVNRSAIPPKRGKWLVAGVVTLAVLAALAGAFLPGKPGNNDAQAPDQARNAVVARDMQTPSPYVIIKPTDGSPNPAASETIPAEETPTPNIIQAAISTPAPTKQPPGVVILPNGVLYGDHKPNLPDRIVRVASPNIKLDTPVYEVYVLKNQWEVADYAAGHNYNSKNPGEGGNIVLSGHNNWRGEVFRYLEFLKPGDEIDVWTLAGKEYKYKVEDIEKLKEAGATLAQRLNNGKVMDSTPYEQLTLITCWPYTTYTHRLIVTAKPSD